jgi:UDP-glucuronate decarboxylase
MSSRLKEPSTILITGGAGFVASHLAERLAEKNHVIVLDNLATGDKEKVPSAENIKFIKGSSNSRDDLNRLFLAYPIDYVFHYAAVVGVKRTLEYPLSVLEDIDGFKYLLENCRWSNVKRVFFSSSSEVYGESPSFPQDEHVTPLNSRLPYAIVKNVGEAYLRSYQQEHGLEYTIFRFFNTYGPRQSTDFVMSKFIDAAMNGRNITIYGDGQQTRTFCYVKDNIDATVNAFEKNLVINDVVNIGSNLEVSINELAKTIIRLTGSKSKITHLPPLKEGDMPRRLPVVGKMKKLLGHNFTPLEKGIKATLEYNHKHAKI